MADEINVWPQYSATAVSDGGATETAILTTGGIDTTPQQERVLITGIVSVTPGTAATAIVVKVRRGSGVSGAEVGSTETQTGAAGTSQVVSFHVEDNPGEVEGEQYTITVTETSATAPGTVSVVTCSITTHG